MQNVVIVHRWSGTPEDDWYPWLKKELEFLNCRVIIPKMPNTDNPEIEGWICHLEDSIKNKEDLILIGHSIGCQTILRTLERGYIKAKNTFFVAPWFRLSGLESKEEKDIAKPWLERKIDFKKVKENCKEFTAIFSDNDPFVPIENVDLFKKNIDAKTIIEHNQLHFNFQELPALLEEVKKCL